MIYKNDGHFFWYEFNLFQAFPQLKHGVLTASYLDGDSKKQVLDFSPKNPDRDKLLEKLQNSFSVPSFVLTKQIHTDQISTAQENSTHLVGDAMITKDSHVPLLTLHADCQIALFFDPKKNVVANVHSGWRGSNLNIYAKTIADLKESYGCLPQDLLVGIGPSLGPKWAEFIHYEKELSKDFIPYKTPDHHFNFWDISENQLLNAGILPHHIEIARMCTYELEDQFFSYRRDKTLCRNASFVCLHP